MGQAAQLWRGQISSLGAAGVGFTFPGLLGRFSRPYQPACFSWPEPAKKQPDTRGKVTCPQLVRQSQASDSGHLPAPEFQGLGNYFSKPEGGMFCVSLGTGESLCEMGMTAG